MGAETEERNRVIPVKNIYYMLAYAFRALNSTEYHSLKTEKFSGAADLYAAILSIGISSQIKQGLNKEFTAATQYAATVRGKIDISESIKSRSMLNHKLFCEYDEYTVNSYMNQVIKATVNILLKMDISSSRKKELRRCIAYFGEVDSIDYHTINWNFRFDRNNHTYRLLIFVCYLIVKGLIQTQEDGTQIFMSFMDEQRMCRLYERFVLEYFKKEYPALNVGAPWIEWQLDDGFDELLPTMKTDITITDGTKHLIIDTKYYEHTLQTQFERSSIHSGNLYQIFTYVKNKDAELPGEDHSVSGMLLYAKTDEAEYPEHKYQMSGNSIEVRTLNLDCDFTEIAKQLDGIVHDYFPARQK